MSTNQGICAHGSVRGMVGPASQKEWDMSPVLCLDCGRQFRLGRDWYQARKEALALPLCPACVSQTTSGGTEPGAMAGLRAALPGERCSAPDCLSPLPPTSL